MTYAYIRISTRDQNEDRQLAALTSLGISKAKLFLDKQSGKDFNRLSYRRLIKKLKPGDLLIIKSIDRLGRNYKEILEQWRHITKEIQADIRVLDMPLLDTSNHRDLTGTLIADIVLQLLSYVAQSERENIRRRQAEGIAAAKARGVKFGAERKPVPEDFDEWYLRWRRGEITGQVLCEHLGIHVTTVYRWARERGLPFRSMTGKKSCYPYSRTEE
ncbi:MAG: recombinase family protein [Oscillibacter sp.]|jgi:DNA invertase Pin-like site-specific DNA recombinase|nr:recombinase family protein [Oscillibacter sp.]